jgi:Holliday junction resolvasome RuvABC endonuclease subunit
VLYAGFFETERQAGKNTKVTADDTRRIKESCLWLQELITRFKPKLVVVELPLSGAKSSLAAKGMSFATGYTVGLLTLLQEPLGFKIVYYTPYDTKKVCCGHRHAEKDQMIKAAAHAFPHVVWPQKRVKKGNPPEYHPAKSEAIADSLCAILTFVRLNLGKPIL